MPLAVNTIEDGVLLAALLEADRAVYRSARAPVVLRIVRFIVDEWPEGELIRMGSEPAVAAESLRVLERFLAKQDAPDAAGGTDSAPGAAPESE